MRLGREAEAVTEATNRLTNAGPRRFPPYPEYRNSGVQWLGGVPASWDIAPVYARYEVALGKMLDAKRVTGESPGKYLRNVDVQWDAVNIDGLPEMDFPPSDRNRYLLRPGDLLVCEGGEVGRTAIWGGELDECFYQKAIHRVRPWSACDVPRFFYFLMYAMAKRGVFTAGGNPNTIDHLTAVQLRRYRVPIPAAGEQRAIVAFLDRETAKIDALVARKERLIELLQEKRTALITRAVTRGIDPNVPMKDSGVEWLGEIPAHWELMPLKRILCRCDYGISESLGGSGDIRVLTMAHVQGGETLLPDEGSIDAVDRTLVLESGDILFNRTNSRELVAKVGIFRGHRRDQVTFASYLVRLTARDNVEAEWLNYLLNSTGLLGMARSMALLSVNQANLNPTKYQRIVVPMPELSEQRRIAGFAKREATRIDTLIRRVREAIDQLKEFRKALICAAVTGKIDVREAVPR